VIGKNFWERFPEQVGTPTDISYRRTMSHKESLRFEYLDPKSERWFEIASYPSTNDGVSVFFRDITSRRLNGEALRLSEERFRVALKQSPIAVFNLDKELHLTWIYNAQAALVPDSTAEPAAGRTVIDVFPASSSARIEAVALEVLRSGTGIAFLSLGQYRYRFSRLRRDYRTAAR